VIIEFPSNASLFNSFQVLTEKRVLSAPVYNFQTREYIGFLDLRDLVTFVVHSERAAHIPNHNSLKDIVESASLVTNSEITLESLAKKHEFHRVDQDSNLFDVAKILRTNVHRVPYFENGVLVNVVSQSLLIKFLCKRLKDMPSLKTTKVSSVEIGTSPVFTCHADDLARHVFEKLEQKGRFGLAVLGENNVIITQTSAHDLKLWLNMPSSSLLDLPILKFLQRIRSQDIEIQVPVLSCSGKDSLMTIIQKLDATRSHRIFVVDNQFHPVRVVSLTDILTLCTCD